MDDGDAVAGLDQLSIPVPATRDVAGVNFTVQLEGLTQQHRDILQVLVHLQGLHCKNEMKRGLEQKRTT